MVPLAVPSDTYNNSEAQMTEEQRFELASLCQNASVPDRSGEPLSVQEAQQIITELREKAARLLRR